MNRGVLQSSPVQQMMAGNHPDWWSINTMRPPPTHHQETTSPSLPLSVPPPLTFFPQFIPTSTSSSSSSSWHDNQELPESWSQLLLGGLMGEEAANWPTAHQIMAAASSPKSCISTTTTTTTTSFSNNMLDFSGNKADGRQPPPFDRSSECNSSTATGGALKKTRVQPSATQSTFKVRKEKLGDRITTLHQLVSPFGKTDTASVLLEAIGYIRFLHSQIEALSLPYLGSGSSGNMRQQPSVQGERTCIFPEDPGQLLNENCMKKRKGGPDQQDSNEEPKDLKSRGLCLVPVSCTLQVGSDNGAITGLLLLLAAVSDRRRLIRVLGERLAFAHLQQEQRAELHVGNDITSRAVNLLKKWFQRLIAHDAIHNMLASSGDMVLEVGAILVPRAISRGLQSRGFERYLLTKTTEGGESRKRDQLHREFLNSKLNATAMDMETAAVACPCLPPTKHAFHCI
ncbi:hypothetical protein V6N12_020260 [Hibiscus sabdariffa]|uniref:BHLH domain-containing protein n=1 Tax=Hibiscus sabdariffa TaxID=183260 RepID=A0ABR1ZEH2_9ROSI